MSLIISSIVQIYWFQCISEKIEINICENKIYGKKKMALRNDSLSFSRIDLFVHRKNENMLSSANLNTQRA